jgi:hypothetical protein
MVAPWSVPNSSISAMWKYGAGAGQTLRGAFDGYNYRAGGEADITMGAYGS